jgi:SAM-dependent methyltransferase
MTDPASRPPRTSTSPQSSASDGFAQKARAYWTPELLAKLVAGHKYHVLPTTAPLLLRALGLLNKDASMSADSTRKFIQVNHLLAQFRPHLEELNQRHPRIRILDAGCGSSFLTFLLAWAYRELWKHPALLVGIDNNEKLIAKNQATAAEMGASDTLRFSAMAMDQVVWEEVLRAHGEEVDADAKKSRPHAVVALHACDTATDDAIAQGIRLKSDFIAVAPCCQAELARKWKDLADSGASNPLKPAYQNPHLRRELAAHMTDLLRVLILRGHGYEVTTTEFTMSHATPKNTLIMATRRGNYHRESQAEYGELVKWLGGAEIALAAKVPFVA